MERLKIENGVRVIDSDTYHASQGISRSALMHFKRSPLHFWHEYYNPERAPKENTPAMNFGNLVHTLILEEHKFHDNFVLQPKFDRRTRDGKLQSMVFESTLSGRIALGTDDYVKACAMRDRFYSLDACAKLVDGCAIESSIYFTDPVSKLQCKVRPDAWRRPGLVVDIKTTKSVKMKPFQAAAHEYGYFIQAAMIKDALQSIGETLERYVIIAIEKEPPFLIAIYILDPIDIHYARTVYQAQLLKLEEWLESGEWNSLIIDNLCMPHFANFEVTEEYEHE